MLMKTIKLILFTFSIVYIFTGCKKPKSGNRDIVPKRYYLHGELYDKDIIMSPVGLGPICYRLHVMYSFNSYFRWFNTDTQFE